MKQNNSTHKKAERAILVGLVTKKQNAKQTKEYLEELEFLSLTAGAKTIKQFTQNRHAPDSRYFVGKGKLEEIRLFTEENDINLIIFDDELSPAQFRNLDKVFKQCKLLDRNNLILDIFANRARTAHAKTQVELAQYQYLLPRLTRMWTHLERQKGGIGMRGPGETQIETDRRIILKKIALLKKKQQEIIRQKESQRKNRVELVKVALVGYTNVGKSSLMNLLSKSNVFAQNKLFATLDTTIRKVSIKNVNFLLTDTVGFIRKLPHHLVESFKSTLDEVKDANLIIHIVDIAHSNFEEQVDIVNKTLESLGADQKPTITVFNKIDAYSFIQKDDDDLTEKTKKNYSLEDIKQSWMSKENSPSVFISVKEKKNLETLKSLMYKNIKHLHLNIYPHKLLYPDY